MGWLVSAIGLPVTIGGITIVLLAVTVIMRRRMGMRPLLASRMRTTLLAVTLAASLWAVVTVTCGLRHGAYAHTNFEVSIPTFWHSVMESPVDDSTHVASADDTRGRVVLLYRFGCPDCEAAYATIVEHVSELPADDVLWLSSRSAIGHELCETYDVQWVPSVLLHDESGLRLVYDVSETDTTGLDEVVGIIGERTSD